MDEQLRENIQIMAGDLDVSGVLADWDRYFHEYRIPEDKQQEEFDGIVRARLFAGQVSIAAPTDNEKGLSEEMDDGKD